MTKHLRVEVNGAEWVNGDFAEIAFTDGPGGVKIEGRAAGVKGAGGSSGGLLDLLAAATRNRNPAPAADAAEPPDVVEAGPVDQA